MRLKKQFESILERYGHHILLVHNEINMPCLCYDTLTGSSDNKCPICFGMGVVPEISKHLVREQDSNLSNALSFISDTQLFGELSIPGRFYFFKAEADIRVHDLIVDVDWDGEQPVYSNRGLFEVSHIDKKRFERGEFVFQKVYTKDTPIQKNIRAINIVNKYGQDYYYIEERAD